MPFAVLVAVSRLALGLHYPGGRPAEGARHQQHEALAARSLQTYASSPSEFDRYLKGELEKWARLVKAARIALD